MAQGLLGGEDLDLLVPFDGYYDHSEEAWPTYLDRDDVRGLPGWWNPDVFGGGMRLPVIDRGYLQPHIPSELLKHYAKYMETAQWRALRRKVFKRAKKRCEFCRERTARVVHHTTYERLFFERLTDLLGLCYTCHALMHPGNEALADRTSEDEMA